MNKGKVKDFIKEIYIPHEWFDYVIYLALIVFLIFIIYINANFITTILIALLVMIILLIFYILQSKFILTSKQKELARKMDSLSYNELKKIICKFYKDKDYKVVLNAQDKIYITKNNNVYLIMLFLKKEYINFKQIKPDKRTKGTIIITDKDLTKEERKIIKEKKIYSITRNGLLEIIKKYENQKKKGNNGDKNEK